MSNFLIPPGIVSREFKMNPATDDLLSSGKRLENGMIVLIADNLFRSFSRPQEHNRWCRVTEMSFGPNNTVSFVAVYADGEKIKRTVGEGYAWYYKKPVEPRKSSRSELIGRLNDHQKLSSEVRKIEVGDFVRGTFQFELGDPFVIEGFVTPSYASLTNPTVASLMVAQVGIGTQCVRQDNGSIGGNLVSIEAHYKKPAEFDPEPEMSALEKATRKIKHGEFVVVTLRNNYLPNTKVRGYAECFGDSGLRVGARTLITGSGIFNDHIENINEHYPR